MRRLVCSLALCALTPALTAAQSAVTTAAASWSVQPSPNVSTFNNFLAGVAATSASNAWAVGSYQNGTAPDRTLIEHWNGQAWAIQPSPNASSLGNNLTHVAAASAANAWAVGYFFQGSGIRTLIEHWNGQRWAVQPSPNPGTVNQLYGVAATSAINAWAVGSYQTGTAPARTLIEHWNGRRWAIQPSPNPGTSGNDLSSVAATSAANAWAVGSYRGLARTLILHYH
jgi:hypothetical protein